MKKSDAVKIALENFEKSINKFKTIEKNSALIFENFAKNVLELYCTPYSEIIKPLNGNKKK